MSDTAESTRLTKTKEQLLEELAEAHARIAEMEMSQAEHERRVAELAIVNEIGQVVSSTIKLDDLIQTVYQQVGRLFDTSGFYMATCEEGSDEWMLVFARDRSQLYIRRNLDTGFGGYIIHSRQHLVFHSSEEMNAFQRARGIEAVGSKAHSWMGVPLMVADKVVGMMGIQSYEHENLYDEQDLTLFSTVAAQVAPALNNLRLLEETRRRAQQMEIINEVGQAITSVLDSSTVLQQVVDMIKVRFGHYFVGIVLVDRERLLFQSGSTISDSDVRPGYALEKIDLRQGPSLIAEAARTGQPVLVNDTSSDPRYLAMEEFPDIRSELCLPIKVEGRVIGVLDVQSDRIFAYDQADVEILSALASQAGIAIDNARLFKEALARAEELAVLNELGQVFTTRLSVEKVVQAAYRETSLLVDTSSFYIALYDAEKHELTFAITTPELKEEGLPDTFSADTGLSGYIVRNRTSLLIEENPQERMKELGISLLGTRLALSWLGVPLIVGERMLGVMAVQSYTTPRAYGEHERDMLTTIANQVSIALHNAYLFEETNAALAESRNLARELTVLNELGRRLTTCFTVDEVLEQVYEGTCLLMDATNFDVGLYDPDKNEVNFTFNTTESVIDRKITSMSADQGITGYIVKNQVPVLIRGDYYDRLTEMGIEQVGDPALSWLGVPLVMGDQVLGVISVQSYDTPHRYDEGDQEILVAIANQASVALLNVQMMEGLEQKVQERTAELRESLREREQLQQEIIEAQKQALRELSAPVIPVMDRIIVMPLIGSIDSMRARDITRSLLAGIRKHRAKMLILDITGVPIVDSGVANHLHKTIHAARLKGARTIVTGVTDAVAETIVDLGIDWSNVDTLSDLQTGLIVALKSMGFWLTR